MSKLKTSLTLLLIFSLSLAKSQDNYPINENAVQDSLVSSRYFLRTSYLCFVNSTGPVNIHMYEIFGGYRINQKDIVGFKAATWKLFEPMGIQLWNPLLLKESEWFDGRLREYGFGAFYQRMLWKGLYASVEVMPMKKVFLDGENEKIATGFRLYTSYHIGYHVSFLKDRLFIEPQIHCNYWPINTQGPKGFKEQMAKHDNYFLFEPNLYIGFNF